ncbi:alpha/beta fold hydrolase [Flavihumibacter petaseus]|nr:alpha/beta hydrolase [Flavihumibacter petaseus]
MKRSLAVLLVVMISWLVFAQSCMTFRTPDKKSVAAFREDGIYLKTFTRKQEGHHIHYVQTGSDTLPTLFFVHGTPGSWTAFEPYLRDSLLRTKYRLISIDRPGFGYSDYGAPMDLPSQSLLMGPVILSLKNSKPFWLVGHSLGGPMIIQLELDFPTLADGLVIISGSIDPAAEKPEKWRPVLFKTPLNLFVPGAMRPSNEELWYLKSDLVELKERLGRLQCPVVFIHGKQDTWVPPINVDYGLKMMTGSSRIDTIWLEGNHFIPWTRFSQIRDVLYHLY